MARTRPRAFSRPFARSESGCLTSRQTCWSCVPAQGTVAVAPMPQSRDDRGARCFKMIEPCPLVVGAGPTTSQAVPRSRNRRTILAEQLARGLVVKDVRCLRFSRHAFWRSAAPCRSCYLQPPGGTFCRATCGPLGWFAQACSAILVLHRRRSGEHHLVTPRAGRGSAIERTSLRR